MASKKKEMKYQPSGEVQRVISLGGGAYAYICDALGKTHHVKRDSEKFLELIEALDSDMDGRGTKELVRLGWR